MKRIATILALLAFLAARPAPGQDDGVALEIMAAASRAEFIGPEIRARARGRYVTWLPARNGSGRLRPRGQILGVLGTSSTRGIPAQSVYVYIKRIGRRWVVYEESGGQIVARSDDVHVFRTSRYRRGVSVKTTRDAVETTVSVFGVTVVYRK